MSQRTLPRQRNRSSFSSPASNAKHEAADGDHDDDSRTQKMYRSSLLARMQSSDALLLALTCTVVSALFVYNFGLKPSLPQSSLPRKYVPATAIRPEVAWLMSFPNSGTSFVMRLVREDTNSATATNYGLEGDIQDEASVPAIPGRAGENGPWLDTIRGFYPETRDVILTNTHCAGYCSGRCPHETTQTPRSFMAGCLEGKQGAYNERGELDIVVKSYAPELVTRAVHLMRHPLDNIVARFHRDYNNHQKDGLDEFVKLFPKNEMGFRRWCALDHLDANVLTSRFVDDRLKKVMENLPCLNEFYKYVQWHNLAYATTRDMGIPAMTLRYESLSGQEYPETRRGLLEFLEAPSLSQGLPRESTKDYRYYYTSEQKHAIIEFLKEFSTAETWEQLKAYDFGE